MKIYSDTKLDNTLLTEEAGRLNAAGFISSGQYDAIKSNLQGLKTQDSLLLRTGLFLLGGILFISLCGVCSLMLLNSYSEGFLKFIVFLFAVIGFAGAEIMIKSKGYYGYGLEEAFILGGQIAFVVFISMLNADSYNYGEGHRSVSVPLATVFIGLISVFRYINLLSVIVAFAGVVWTFITFFTDTVYLGYLFLPLLLLVFAAVFSMMSERIYNKLNQPYYSGSIELAKNLGLILFYLSCNVYIVFDWLSSFNHGHPSVSDQFPAIVLLFWIFTFAVPPAYIYVSLKKKSRVMFWTGCLALACSFITFRVYYQVLPLEYALSMGGILFFTIALLAITKLKHKAEGITFKPDRFDDKNALMNTEVLMVTSQLGIKPLDNSGESKPFSGGEGFNGGGSGGTF